MAFISKSIHLVEGDYPYESFVNGEGNIFINQEGDESWYNYIVINKKEWEMFKNFIDEQLKEYNEGE